MCRMSSAAIVVMGLAALVGPAADGPSRQAWVDQCFGKMPLYFIENPEQVDPRGAITSEGRVRRCTSRRRE